MYILHKYEAESQFKAEDKHAEGTLLRLRPMADPKADLEEGEESFPRRIPLRCTHSCVR